MNVDYLERVDWWSRVDIAEDDECWLWNLSCGSHGYGQSWDGRTVLLAHRIAWTLTHGPIPADLTIDHRCRVRRCCNPRHLRLMTNVENARGNAQSLRTHCPHGHPYSGDNLYVSPKGDRRCRACAVERRRVLRDELHRSPIEEGQSA